MSISPETKQRWLRKGTDAFGAVAPAHRGQGYCCPICLGISPSPVMFSAEDVPPASVGGKPLLLTCRDCNSKGGSEIDWHWANFSAVEGFLTGDVTKPVTVNFMHAGLKVVGELSKSDQTYTIAIIKDASRESTVKELETLVADTINAGQELGPINLGFYKSRYEQRLVMLSVLRAAYLTGIAVAGYSMIPWWNPIRLQILNPQVVAPKVSRLVQFQKELLRDRRELGEIKSPPEMHCLCVGFGRWTAFLPYGHESPLYASGPLDGRPVEFTGIPYMWPTEPTFGVA